MPDSGTPSPLSRRGLLAAGGATAAGALLTACGGNGGSSAAPAGPKAGGGPWSFTDDRRTRLTAEAVPSRVVAFTGSAAALVDFGVDRRIVGVFGETTLKNGRADPQAGDLDVDRVTVLGNVYGEFSVEKYAALRPDLLVTHMYEPGALWYVPDESRKQILALAPSAAITTGRVPITEPINRYSQLAASLGADPKAAKAVAAKARFEAAADTLRRAAKANGGLRVLAASGSNDLLYVSNPGVSTDLMYFAQLGVDVVVPRKPGAGGYYESLSWENAGKYHADLILLDDRGTALRPKALAANPAWAQLPAVKAGQVTPWDSVPRFSHAGAAPLLERLAKAVGSARKVR